MVMSKRKEKISAFLDNDMHRDELMSFSLSAESDDAKTAQRYQMIGDAMRGEMSEASFVDVSDAVREAIMNESLDVQPVSSPVSDSTAQTGTGLFDLSAWFRPLAGMAVAASVAVVMVVTLSQQGADDFSPGLAPVANNIEKQPAAKSTTVAVDNSVDAAKVAEANKKATELNPYINQHLEFATQDALQGRLPYVRAVNYEAEK